jgi:hypothetical protein
VGVAGEGDEETAGAGQTPAGAGGADESPWPSYLNPSASPSRKVWLEMPSPDAVHAVFPRLTYMAQKGLLAVQHPGGYDAGSRSIWHTALPNPGESTVAYCRLLPASSWSPVSESAVNATHTVTVAPLACSTTRAAWCRPAASAHTGAAPRPVAVAVTVSGMHTAAAARILATRRISRTSCL